MFYYITIKHIIKMTTKPIYKLIKFKFNKTEDASMTKTQQFSVSVRQQTTVVSRPQHSRQGSTQRFRRPSSPPQSAWATEEYTTPITPETVFQAGLRHHHLANTAYPIAHRQTIWQYRQPANRHAELLARDFRAHKEMGLYVHIPFCERCCAFCEYTVVDNHGDDIEARYHRALLQELDLYDHLLDTRRTPLVGLDIGGGTPSIVQPQRIGELLERIVRSFPLAPDFGVSIETTPKIAATHPERLAAYRQFGINRISMGLQMVNPRLLKEYGRDTNTLGHNDQAVENIRKAGFRRFNIDVMYGFSKQTAEDFQRTLDYTIALNPEYITLYRMRYKGTSVAAEASEIELQRIVGMYTLARKTLTAAGYAANAGKNGFSRVPGDPGTSEYLTRRVVRSTPYLGLGLGAQTFTNTLLAYNHGAASKRMQGYLYAIDKGQLPIQDLYHLPLGDAISKMVSVSFYFGQIYLDAFRHCFGMEFETRFPEEVAFVLKRGLMEYHGDMLRLTSAGAQVINGVIALFYSNRVKEYLIGL